jgi:predicted neuraminidase
MLTGSTEPVIIQRTEVGRILAEQQTFLNDCWRASSVPPFRAVYVGAVSSSHDGFLCIAVLEPRNLTTPKRLMAVEHRCPEFGMSHYATNNYLLFYFQSHYNQCHLYWIFLHVQHHFEKCLESLLLFSSDVRIHSLLYRCLLRRWAEWNVCRPWLDVVWQTLCNKRTDSMCNLCICSLSTRVTQFCYSEI